VEAAGDTADVRCRVEFIDGIIVTQTCDLENTKVANILLARVTSWADFAAAQFVAGNTAVKSSGFRRSLISVSCTSSTAPGSTSPSTSRVNGVACGCCPLQGALRSGVRAVLHARRLPHDARAFEKDGAAAVKSLG
jgi:hypothetical protein